MVGKRTHWEKRNLPKIQIPLRSQFQSKTITKSKTPQTKQFLQRTVKTRRSEDSTNKITVSLEKTAEMIILNFAQNSKTLYEKLILQRVMDIEDAMKVDLTGVNQHILMNRLSLINDSINYEWLNLSKDTYKIKCKEKNLSWNAVFKLNWILITMTCKWFIS